MKTAKRQRSPANDFRPAPTQKISCVVATHSIAHWKRTASFSVLMLFTLLLVVTLIRPPSTNTVAKSETEDKQLVTQEEPFDIVLSASDQDESAVEETPRERRKAVLDVSVEGEESTRDGNKASKAREQAAKAHEYLTKGDMTRALQYEARAVQLAPDNMVYRLQLAIMHDRVSDTKIALDLYRQVVEAYDENKRILPPSVDIESIRERMAYLAGS